MKKETFGSVKDLAILNYNIIKRKSRPSGRSVCLCTMEKDSNAILVAKLDDSGKILESQVFIFTKTTKKQVMKMARKAFNNMLDNIYA